MQDLLEILTLAYKKLSAQNIVLFLLLIKIAFCAVGGLIVTYIHSKFSYKWLRNNFNIYVGITLPVIGLVITTVNHRSAKPKFVRLLLKFKSEYYFKKCNS